MRRQELIYAQNSGFVKNKIIGTVNTSSDVCVFTSPKFLMTGASKLISGMSELNTGVHIIDNDNEVIDLNFSFIDEPTIGDTNFSYNIYKFDDRSNVFKTPSIFVRELKPYSSFAISNQISDTISVDNLADGEYLLKPFYEHKTCTGILGNLGVRNVTLTTFKDGDIKMYNPEYDFYFVVIYKARVPIIGRSSYEDREVGRLNVIPIIPTGDGQTIFDLETSFNGSPIVTLNGLVMAPEEDYTIDGTTITFVAPTYVNDIINIIFVGSGSINGGLVSDTHIINKTVSKGNTGQQGDEKVYYNSETNKYEFYLNSDPINGNDIIISINGAILANGIDYYQSRTNKRRIIFEGELIYGDIITAVYNSYANIVGGVNQPFIPINWTIDKAPTKINGKFIVELATSPDFTTIVSSGEVDYIVGNKVYNHTLQVSGSVGSKRYYRIVNEKNFTTILGDVITTRSYSEVIPIVVQTNSFNSY